MRRVDAPWARPNLVASMIGLCLVALACQPEPAGLASTTSDGTSPTESGGRAEPGSPGPSVTDGRGSASGPGTLPALPTEAGERVKLAASIAEAVHREPDRVEEILEAHGLTRETLDDLMFEIASDPELTRQYKLERARA